MLSDLRYGIRLLHKNQAEMVLIILIIGVAVGANTAVFSVVNSIYFQDLPFRDTGSLVRLQDFTRTPDGTLNIYNTWGSHFNAIVRQSKELQCAAAMDDDPVTMATPEGALKVTVILQSSGSLSCLGLHPAWGREFTRSEEEAGAQSGVLLITSAFAQRQFGTVENALNRTVQLQDRPFLIVGVMPKGYRFPYEADAWTPTTISDAIQSDYAVVGRLKPTSSLPRLRSELAVIAARIRSDISGTHAGFGIQARPLRETLIDETVTHGEAHVTLTLFALVTFFLLMACASIGHLLLARTTVRIPEFAVRTMLGASIPRLAKQVLIETIVISLLGSALGFILAITCKRFLVAIVPSTLRNEIYAGDVPLDWRIVIFNVAIAFAIALLCSLFPMFQLLKSDLALQSKAGGRAASMSRAQRQMLAAFVLIETAFGFALFAAANGMNSHFSELLHPKLGFQPDSLLTFQVSLAGERYAAPERRVQFVREAVRTIGDISGVSGVGIMTTNPLWYGTWAAAVRPPGETRDADAVTMVNHRLVTPGLLETMKISLLRGRTITPADVATSPPVAVVSRKMAHRLFGQQDPIGKRLEWVGRNRPTVTVVGVVDDVKDSGQMSETWYIPYYQQPTQFDALTLHFMVRTAVAPEGVVLPIRKALANADPKLPMYEAQPMSGLYDRTIAQDKVGNIASTVFAVLGLSLLSLGTYGVLSFVVNANKRSTAIRLALGAPAAVIRNDIFAQGLKYVGAGIVCGAVLVQTESRLAQAWIAGLRIATWENYLSGVTLLVLIALLACFVPALRAGNSDPLEVLRSE